MPDRQQQQADLLEEAQSVPGVADAIALYEAINRQAIATVQQRPTVHYATGGNG